ncbi:MAG: Spy/CpxP family protein refolding chaperone [Acidobacteriota bacterium]
MWKRKWRCLGAGVVGVLLAGTLAWAQAPRRPRPEIEPGLWAFWDRSDVKEQLQLTETQIDELRNRAYESARSRIASRSQIQLLELELRRLMDSEAPDEEGVRAKAREIGELRAQAYLDRAMERLALKRILTPEQQEQLRELRQRRHRRPRTDRPRLGRGNPGEQLGSLEREGRVGKLQPF